jgi:hypothetical protein
MKPLCASIAANTPRLHATKVERKAIRVRLIVLGATVCFSRIEPTSHGSPARGLAADVVVLPLHTRH